MQQVLAPKQKLELQAEIKNVGSKPTPLAVFNKDEALEELQNPEQEITGPIVPWMISVTRPDQTGVIRRFGEDTSYAGTSDYWQRMIEPGATYQVSLECKLDTIPDGWFTGTVSYAQPRWPAQVAPDSTRKGDQQVVSNAFPVQITKGPGDETMERFRLLSKEGKYVQIELRCPPQELRCAHPDVTVYPEEGLYSGRTRQSFHSEEGPLVFLDCDYNLWRAGERQD